MSKHDRPEVMSQPQLAEEHERLLFAALGAPQFDARQLGKAIRKDPDHQHSIALDKFGHLVIEESAKASPVKAVLQRIEPSNPSVTQTLTLYENGTAVCQNSDHSGAVVQPLGHEFFGVHAWGRNPAERYDLLENLNANAVRSVRGSVDELLFQGRSVDKRDLNANELDQAWSRLRRIIAGND